MTASSTGREPHPSRLLVQRATDVPERMSRGNLRVRQVFQTESAGFKTLLFFVLWNRIPAGGANEPHVHDDIEKVYYYERPAIGCGSAGRSGKI